MYLVLAIVLGLYWVVRICTDEIRGRHFKKEYEKEAASDQERKAAWLSSVTNHAVEDALEYKIYSRDKATLKEVRETWNRYYERELPTLISYNNPKDTKRYIYDGALDSICDFDCLRILMCNRGYLTMRDATIGMDVYCPDNLPAYEIRGRWAVVAHFVRAVDSQLRSRGVSETIYYERFGDYEAFTDFNQRISTVVGFYGALLWRPAISTCRLQSSNGRHGTNYR